MNQAIRLGQSCSPDSDKNPCADTAFCHWRRRVCTKKYKGCDLSTAKTICGLIEMGGIISPDLCDMFHDKKDKDKCNAGATMGTSSAKSLCTIVRTQICDFKNCPENKLGGFCRSGKALGLDALVEDGVDWVVDQIFGK